MVHKLDLTNFAILKNAASYPMWAFQIKIAFDAEDLMRFVDGTIPVDRVPPDQISLWHTKDAEAKLYIMMTTDQMVNQHLITCNTSKQMYDKLRNIYEKDTEHQRCHLLQELYSYK